ncbi:MAG: hypothetical protein H0U89_01705, partial [Acidimicrobiia bacterium]|nr:hypothetical protein [Acidimicrobiia bacterium]
LSAAEVVSSEAYLAPVAALLVMAGARARRRAVAPSSWSAYGPAVVLLGGSALLERLVSGDAGHALVAGTVGVVAVAVGGTRRLVGPLVLGTAVLVTVTVTETLAWTAGVPTWAWLAAAGSVLLGTGVALERAGTSPLEAGQKVADVLAARFS